MVTQQEYLRKSSSAGRYRGGRDAYVDAYAAPPPVVTSPAAGGYYGSPPAYRFAPERDPVAERQAARMQALARERLQQVQQSAAAERFLTRSQYLAPRQSRMTLLEGY